MNELRQGRCLCGAVSYSVAGEPGSVRYCHCTMCRRQTGHFLAAISLKAEQVKINGAEAVTWYESSDEAERGFCARCGSVLFWRENGSDGLAVAAGSLDLPTGLKSEAHIFVADKGDYYEINDGLPQYAESDVS